MIVIDVRTLKQLPRHSKGWANSFAFQVGYPKVEKRIVTIGFREILSLGSHSPILDGCRVIGPDAKSPVGMNTKLNSGVIIS